MNKKELFRIMSKSRREQVIDLAKKIEQKHPVIIVKKPAKTLVMLKMKDPVAKAEFYLGELLACEAMVKVHNQKGMAVTAGDDFEKVLAMSIVDAAYNANVEEVSWINEQLNDMEKEVRVQDRKEFGRHMKSKVQFRIMEEQS
ncbi:MAG: phosphonate C-P lyase system protein PhnG [Thermotaleaceae bacterium]